MSNPQRLILDDIVEDPNGENGIVEHISASGKWVMVEYEDERFELHATDTLKLYASAFNPKADAIAAQIRKGSNILHGRKLE